MDTIFSLFGVGDLLASVETPVERRQRQVADRQAARTARKEAHRLPAAVRDGNGCSYPGCGEHASTTLCSDGVPDQACCSGHGLALLFERRGAQTPSHLTFSDGRTTLHK